MKNIKTLFLGSNWEALEMLKVLNKDKRFDLVAIITQPDKPVGRKKLLQPTEVKQFAIDNDIPVFHTMKDRARYKEALALFKPELIICLSFGEIIPGFFLETPKYKAINVHFSLLPKYRGAVPIQMAIKNGEEETGISIMLMEAGLDSGDVLDQVKIDINQNDTNLTLRQKLVEIATERLPDVVEAWIEGNVTAVKQDDSKATFCYQKDISKENALIDWENDSAIQIERSVRALLPWPVVWTFVSDKRVKIFKASVLDLDALNEDESTLREIASSRKLGEIFKWNERVFFKTKDTTKVLEVLELQMEGKNVLQAKEFAKGLN